MKVSWFKNPDNVVYVEAAQFIKAFGEEMGIANLEEKILDFDARPAKEGLTLTGTKRTAIKLFIPDLVFAEHIEMGENVWIYMGENYECYCLYNIGGPKSEIEGENYKFMSHKDCEYFPCHRTVEPDNFNCIFCYCPLYAMGRDCGGNFIYLHDGTKDCSGCMVPHTRGNYDRMIKKMMEFHDTLKAKEKANNR